MAKRWSIVGPIGSDGRAFEHWIPGTVGHRQVEEILRRLHCRHISEVEIIKESMNGRDRKWVAPNLVGDDPTLTTAGTALCYSARLEDV